MSYAISVTAQHPSRQSLPGISVFPLRVLHAFTNLPTFWYLAALTAMLFRPPDLKSFPIDRIAFAALVILVGVRFLMARERIQVFPATWPFFGLLLLGLWGAVAQPHDAQSWSLFAAKWFVPFSCFHFAGAIFRDESSLRKLEVFLLLVLGYLSVVSILSLLNAPNFIFPRFIVDESIGIHADRARGPFLQAVANGVCLNLLALCALDSYGRGRLRGGFAALLFFAIPMALLATKTRAVWFAASVSVIYLVLFGPTRRQRRVALGVCIAALLGAAIVWVVGTNTDSFSERLVDRSPVDFRSEMYHAGWQMFTEKPLLGWGNEWQVQPEIEKRISGFRADYYVFHNTFLELGVQRGLLGLSLYLWLWVCLFRLGNRAAATPTPNAPFSSPHFCSVWPMFLVVYLLNASAVVMNYQFLNAVVFTIAGILASQSLRTSDARFLKQQLAGE